MEKIKKSDPNVWVPIALNKGPLMSSELQVDINQELDIRRGTGSHRMLPYRVSKSLG